MPIHIYECGDCGARADYLVGQGQEPSGCAECRSSNLTRTFEGQTFNSRTADKSGIHERPFTFVPSGPPSLAMIRYTEKDADENTRVVGEQPAICVPARKVFPGNN